MSPTRQEEPTNAHIAELIRSHHRETSSKLEETGRRLGIIEHHIVDPKYPERTLPVRVQRLEWWNKAARWAMVTVVGGMLAAGGAWLWDRVANQGSKSKDIGSNS